jgi:hypothetical protein
MMRRLPPENDACEGRRKEERESRRGEEWAVYIALELVGQLSYDSE